MIRILNVFWAESLKLRRSRAPLMTALAYAMAPLAAAVLMLVGAASLPLRADWPRYMAMLAGASGVGGLVVFGLFLIWIFGREHADNTAKELLTLPIPREMIVAGKLAVAAAWCLALQCGMAALGLLIGACLNLQGWSWEACLPGLARTFGAAGLAYLASIPFAYLANLSRGTMAAVGALFMVLCFALLLTALGWGAWFPWAAPALYGGDPGLGSWSLALVALTGAAGTAGSMLWWRRADQR